MDEQPTSIPGWLYTNCMPNPLGLGSQKDNWSWEKKTEGEISECSSWERRRPKSRSMAGSLWPGLLCCGHLWGGIVGH